MFKQIFPLLLLLTFGVTAEAKLESCADRLSLSARRLRSLELLGHRNPGFFNEQTSSQRLLLVEEVESTLTLIDLELRRPHVEDDYSAQMERTAEIWRETGLLAKIRASLKPTTLRNGERPYRLLARPTVENIALAKSLVGEVRPTWAFRQAFDRDVALKDRVEAVQILNRDLERLLFMLGIIRRDLDMKQDDLERVYRLLDRAETQVIGNIFLKSLLQSLPTAPDLQMRQAARRLADEVDRLKITTWYLRNRGLK